MSAYLQNTTAPERVRGKILAEKFTTRRAVLRNGGELIGQPMAKRRLILNGTDQYARFFGATVPFIGNFSASIKIKTDTAQNCFLIDSRGAENVTSGSGISIAINNGILSAEYSDGSTVSSDLAMDITGYDDGEWHAVTFTVERPSSTRRGSELVPVTMAFSTSAASSTTSASGLRRSLDRNISIG